MKPNIKWIAAGIAALTALIFIDTSYTVQLKSMLVRLLPIDDETKASIINRMCVGAFAGAETGASFQCYYTFYGREFETRKAEVNKRREFCVTIRKNMVESPSDWHKAEGMGPERYLYLGKGDLSMEQRVIDLSRC